MNKRTLIKFTRTFFPRYRSPEDLSINVGFNFVRGIFQEAENQIGNGWSPKNPTHTFFHSSLLDLPLLNPIILFSWAEMIVIKYKVYTDMAVLPFPPSPSEVTPKFISLRPFEIRKYRCDPRAQRGWLRMDRVIKVYLVQQNMSYVNGSNMQRELAPLGKSHYTSRYSHPTLASRTVALAKWLLFRLLVSFPNRREEKVEDPTWKKWS